MKRKTLIFFLFLLILPIAYSTTFYENFNNLNLSTSTYQFLGTLCSAGNESFNSNYEWTFCRTQDYFGYKKDVTISSSGSLQINGSTSADNDGYIKVFMPEEINLDDDFYITFEYQHDADGTDSENYYLDMILYILNESEKIEKVTIEITDTNFQAYASFNTNCNIEDLSGTTLLPETLQYFVLTKNDLISNGCIDSFNDATLQDIRFHIYTQGNNEADKIYYLDNLRVTDTPNNLPNVNFTADTSYCYNKTKNVNTIPVDFTINATDDDNDTIYYSFSLKHHLAYNKTIDFDASSCLLQQIPDLCVNWVDFTITDRIYNNELTDTCNFNGDIDTWKYANASQHNIVFYRIGDTLINYLLQDGKNMIQINGFCEGNDKGLYSNFDKAYNKIEFYSYLNNLDINESFMLRLLDSFNLPIVETNITRNDTGVYFYVRNESSIYGPVLFNEIISDETIDFLEIGIIIDREDNLFDLSIGDYSIDTRTKYQDLPTLQDDEHSAFSFSITPNENNTFYLDGYSVSGFYSGPTNWNTTKPTQVITHNLDFIPFTLYVTDEYHLEKGDYVEKTEYVNVELCDYTMAGIIENVEDVTDLDLENQLPLLELSKATIGNALRDYMKDLGYYEKSRYAVGILWIIVFLGILIGGYLTFRAFDMQWALMIPSILCALLSYYLEHTAQFITYLIVVVLGFTPVFSSIFYKRVESKIYVKDEKTNLAGDRVYRENGGPWKYK